MTIDIHLETELQLVAITVASISIPPLEESLRKRLVFLNRESRRVQQNVYVGRPRMSRGIPKRQVLDEPRYGTADQHRVFGSVPQCRKDIPHDSMCPTRHLRPVC